MKPILMDNAFEAWAAAIRYCNDIKDSDLFSTMCRLTFKFLDRLY